MMPRHLWSTVVPVTYFHMTLSELTLSSPLETQALQGHAPMKITQILSA